MSKKNSQKDGDVNSHSSGYADFVSFLGGLIRLGIISQIQIDVINLLVDKYAEHCAAHERARENISAEVINGLGHAISRGYSQRDLSVYICSTVPDLLREIPEFALQEPLCAKMIETASLRELE